MVAPFKFTPLSARAEAGEDAAVLLLALNDALMPAMSDEQADAFCRLLDINTPEAHLAAAMMLKPEGWWIQHLGECIGGWLLRMETNGPPSRSIGIGFSPANPAPSPAHALIAAIARSIS